MHQHVKALLFIFVLGFLTFSNGFNNPFLIDDHAFFEEKLQNIKYLPLHFLPDKNRVLHIEGESADPFYRPLATVIPMLSYLTWHNNTTGHHITNYVLMCLAGWGIYLFFIYLGAPYLVAFLTAVLYVIHPINGVVVNYITASIFAVQVMLMLGALYFLISAWHKGLKSSPVRMITACVLYLFSTWCHETAMFLPVYAMVVLSVFSKQQYLKDKCKEAWSKTWPLFGILGAIFIFRMFYSSLGVSILHKITLYHMSFPQYLATWTMLLAWYLSRLFWFQHIVLIMAHQPLTQGIGIWLVLLVALISLALFLIWFFRRNKIVLVGLLWFVFGFVPFTLACFFQPIHGLMIEPHWFLFPVIGFFVCVAGILVELMNHKRILARCILVVIVFCSVFFSRWHNWVWGDELRYCDFWLKQSPAFVAVNGYMAKAYEFRGDNEHARWHYHYMINRGYKNYISYTNLGLMDLKEGKWDSAKANFLEVMKLDPRASVAVNNLGVIYFKDENYTKALECFERARDLNRFLVLPYLDISKTYLKLGNQEKAIQALREVLDIVPGQESAMVDLIQIYITQKDKDNILDIARMMLRYSQNPYTLRNAGILLQQYGFSQEAQKGFIKAKRIFNAR